MTDQSTIEDLARAADDAGARLADGVNDLAERLTPRRLVDDALSAARTRTGELARDAGGLVKSHPVVIGAAVAAVGLALFAGNRISRAELDIDNDLDGFTDYDEPALPAPAAPAPATARIAGVAHDAREIVAENPLLSIVAGLAAGAALALFFPASDAQRGQGDDGL